MPELVRLQKEITDEGNIAIPAVMIPSVRRLVAEDRGLLENVLIITPQSLGDVVCSIPAIRYGTKRFDRLTVATYYPELFETMDGVHEIIDLKTTTPEWDKYFTLRCYYDGEDLNSEFIVNFNTQIVDYISIGLFRNQLPVDDRAIWLDLRNEKEHLSREVVVHPGASWPSKTFPVCWWNEVLASLIGEGIRPTLIGGTTHDGRGVVDVCTVGCDDLRHKLSVRESAALLHSAKVVITNDSAPLHLAAAGHAWIGFLSTVKHPDAITHWRKSCDTDKEYVKWGWRMENLSLGWIYRHEYMNPAYNFVTRFDQATPKELESRLPDPQTVAQWAVEKLRSL